jgi:hypothetical protein
VIMIIHPSEDEVHLSLAEHLQLRARRDVVWMHYPAGGLRDLGTARKMKMMGMKAGVPDFLFIILGLCKGLELKPSRKRRLSVDQTIMHDDFRRAGAEIATAYGIDEALDICTGWGVWR